MADNIGAKFYDFRGAKFNDGQTFFGGDGGQDYQKLHDKIMSSIEAQTEKRTFLGLLPMANQDEQFSPIDPDDPKLYWIFRDEDFIRWKTEDRQVLLLLGGPPGCRMTDVSSHIANKDAKGAVFFFSCRTMRTATFALSITATFALSILRHILEVSDDHQAQSITTTFLSFCLHNILQRDKSRFQDTNPATTMANILHALDDELLEALTEAVDHVQEINETSIIIDGIDKLGNKGAKFLETFCSQPFISPKFKVLLTCRPNTHFKKLVAGVSCIEYDKERQECLNSLRHHGTRYDKISTEHDGTLTWLWKHEKYKAWSSTPHSDLLLIEGKPGSGKSTLTKYFRNNLLDHESLAKQDIVASFFYSYRDGKAQRDHSNMLRSILYDVLNQKETFFYHFQSLYRKSLSHGEHGEWPYDSLQKILLSIKKHPVKERLYLIVDAMDESEDEDRHGIIELFRQLCSNENYPCVVKVFIASRPIVELKHRMAEIGNTIRLQDENQRDILQFVESFLAILELSPAYNHETKDYIVKNAQGVFIWVHLVQKELLKYHAVGFRNQDIYNFLRSLPTELEAFYERMLRELEDNDDQQGTKDGVRMFQLVLFANRPLKVQEIHQALAIPDGIDAKYSPSDESFENELIDDIVKRIIYCGGNFLDIRGNNIVQFAHQTALTFISRLIKPTATSKFRMKEDDARCSISIICIRYLMLCAAHSTAENEPPSTKSWEPMHFEKYAEYLNRRPFIDYALCHFQQHKNDCVLRPKKRKNDCHQCIYDERLVSQLSKKMTGNSASLLFESWIESYLGAKSFRKKVLHTAKIVRLRIESWMDSGRGRDVAAKERRPPAADFRNNMLHTATRMQYSWAVEALLSDGTEKEACLLDKTLLLMSAEAGDVATAEVLLRKGARLDAKDDKYQTALLHAATKGHDTMVNLLVNSGANKEQKDGNGRTALHIAAVNGHDSSVLLLVKTLGTDKEAKDSNKWTALHHAASNGHDSTVQLLVKTLGTDKEAKDRNKWTALHHAASNGHDSTVQLLVKTLGTDKEAKDRNKWTALHHAASNGHDSTVLLLVKTLGTDKEAKDCNKWTALHHAASNCHDTTVRLLVETLGADIDAKDNAGSTLLHIAAGVGNDSIVRLLSTMGASTEVKDSSKRTALHWAAIFGRKGTVKLLVNELRANREAEDVQKHTALHFAASLGHESTVRLLVNILHANKDAKNLEGKTVLNITREFLSYNDEDLLNNNNRIEDLILIKDLNINLILINNLNNNLIRDNLRSVILFLETGE